MKKKLEDVPFPGLASAGMSHVHLLPIYDFGTVNEDPHKWKFPEGDLAQFGPDSKEQQARVFAVADEDAFNWGCDSAHNLGPGLGSKAW